MNILIYMLFGVLAVLAAVATVYAAIRAKPGFEDDTGFHQGNPFIPSVPVKSEAKEPFAGQPLLAVNVLQSHSRAKASSGRPLRPLIKRGGQAARQDFSTKG